MANTPTPFDAAKLKIMRARRHISELDTEIADYLRRDPYIPLLIKNNKTEKHHIATLSRESVPLNIPVIFGDVLYNLRSALDFLANDLVTLCGATPKNVYFPFADSLGELEHQINSKMKGASPEILDIVRSLRPYRGGNKYLRALHDLNIRDKHITILSVSAGMSMEFGMESMAQVGDNVIVSDFSKTPTVPVDPAGFNIRDDEVIVGKIKSSTCAVHIGEKLPLTGSPVIEVTHQLTNLVQGIVETFETHCLGGQ